MRKSQDPPELSIGPVVSEKKLEMWKV
jgi:hypothetical protein